MMVVIAGYQPAKTTVDETPSLPLPLAQPQMAPHQPDQQGMPSLWPAKKREAEGQAMTLEQRIAAAAERCALAKTQAEHAPLWRELVRLIEMQGKSERIA